MALKIIYCFALFCIIFARNTVCHPLAEPGLNTFGPLQRKVYYEVDISNLFDRLTPVIRQLFIAYGLEPMNLTDYWIDTSEATHLPTGHIKLHNGILNGLSKFRRTSELVAWYSDKVITLDANFGWDELTGDFKYLYELFFIDRRGSVHCTFNNLIVNAVIVLKLPNFDMELSELSFTNLENFDVYLEGHLFDPVINKLINLLKYLFRDYIVKALENIFEDMAQMVIPVMKPAFLPTTDPIYSIFKYLNYEFFHANGNRDNSTDLATLYLARKKKQTIKNNK